MAPTRLDPGEGPSTPRRRGNIQDPQEGADTNHDPMEGPSTPRRRGNIQDPQEGADTNHDPMEGPSAPRRRGNTLDPQEEGADTNHENRSSQLRLRASTNSLSRAIRILEGTSSVKPSAGTTSDAATTSYAATSPLESPAQARIMDDKFYNEVRAQAREQYRTGQGIWWDMALMELRPHFFHPIDLTEDEFVDFMSLDDIDEWLRLNVKKLTHKVISRRLEANRALKTAGIPPALLPGIEMFELMNPEERENFIWEYYQRHIHADRVARIRPRQRERQMQRARQLERALQLDRRPVVSSKAITYVSKLVTTPDHFYSASDDLYSASEVIVARPNRTEGAPIIPRSIRTAGLEKKTSNHSSLRQKFKSFKESVLRETLGSMFAARPRKESSEDTETPATTKPEDEPKPEEEPKPSSKSSGTFGRKLRGVSSMVCA